MDEDLKIQADIENSRIIQQFKGSEAYRLLISQLGYDFKRLTNDLIEKELPEVRGALKYIKELFYWFDSKAELEEVINLEKQKLEEDKDW